MALVSILLAVAAFICTLVGFLTTPIPVLGLVFSFGAAAIALGGIMLGGRSISASKREGVPNDMGRIAVVLNVLAFIPALLVAVTCGVCNAIVSSGNVQAHRYLDFNITPGFGPEAGAPALPPPQRLPQPDGPEPGEPAPPPPPGDAPKKQPSTPPPPSNLPPPPLPPGPAGK